ncbi:hypothetical protein ACHAXS_009522, partial [Conticribra weissflogii]
MVSVSGKQSGSEMSLSDQGKSCYRKNKTCLEYRKSKKKCGNYNQDGRCGRCHKKNKTCEPYTSFQGRRNDLTMKRKSI